MDAAARRQAQQTEEGQSQDLIPAVDSCRGLLPWAAVGSPGGFGLPQFSVQFQLVEAAAHIVSR